MVLKLRYLFKPSLLVSIQAGISVVPGPTKPETMPQLKMRICPFTTYCEGSQQDQSCCGARAHDLQLVDHNHTGVYDFCCL